MYLKASATVKLWVTTPILIDLNLVELNYYPFKINLDRYNESCNVEENLSGNLCVPNETRHKC